MEVLTQIVTAYRDKTVSVWDIGFGLKNPPQWFLQLCEAIAGRRLNDQMVPMPVEYPVQEIREIKAKHLNPGNPKDTFVKWARYMLHMDEK